MQKLSKEAKHLIESLSRHKQKYPTESQMIEDFTSFVKQYPEESYYRSLLCGHLTASAFVLNKKLDKVLLTHHKKMGIWIQLGGHADGDKDLLKVALKEAQEESGIKHFNILLNSEIFDVGIRFVPKYKDTPEHYHYDICYALQVQNSEEFTVSEESNDLKWAQITKMKDYSQEEAINIMALKWLNLKE
eukprot:gene9962-2281_t